MSDEELEQELARWQEAIRELVIKESGAPDDAIDGAGCDSGDPLDLTLTEISQGFASAAEREQKLTGALRTAGLALLGAESALKRGEYCPAEARRAAAINCVRAESYAHAVLVETSGGGYRVCG